MVYFAGAVVIGFAIPLTTLVRGHVFVDFLVVKFPRGLRRVFHLLTRLMGIALFSLAGWNLIRMGFDFLRTGEVSLTLQMPVYPVAFGIGFACLAQCLVLLLQAVQVIGGRYE
jgi:TRAP-type C4-dicarboxylate transport system permease small subunit